MSITTVSSREFNQDVSKAKKASLNGPVFITNKGKPSHVLLTVEEFQRITDQQKSMADLLAMPQGEEIEFEAATLKGNLFKPADLS